MIARRVNVLAQTGDILGETPLWCERTASLWWLDVDRQTVRCIDASAGAQGAFVLDGDCVGSLAFAKDGDLLVGVDDKLKIVSREGQ